MLICTNCGSKLLVIRGNLTICQECEAVFREKKEDYVYKHCIICQDTTPQVSQGDDVDNAGKRFQLSICSVCGTVNTYDTKEVVI